MIFRYQQLLGIKSGAISLAFRRWQKPNVKEGSTMTTAAGVIRVVGVEKIDEATITRTDATKAGYDDINDLLKDLRKGKGSTYKVKVKYVSADPRLELREKTDISEQEIRKILIKLERLDKTRGPWVLKVMKLIKKYPERRAGDLAEIMTMDKFDFKINVRKLKNLGLTVSHEIGYSISPLGDIILDKMT